MEPDEFEQLMSKVERAFGVGAATILASAYGTPEIDIFDPESAEFSADEWAKFRPIIQNLDQLIEFAFDATPEGVIRDWVSAYAEGDDEVQRLLDRTQEYVTMIQKHGQVIGPIWRAKSRSILPILGLPRVRLVRGGRSGRVEAQLSIAVSSASSSNVTPRVEEFIVQLVPSDVAMLQHMFSTIAEEMKAESPMGGGEQ